MQICLITFKWHFHSVESIVFYLEHHQTLYEGEEAYFREAVIYNFWCPWILIYWKTVLWIVIEVYSVKHELPKTSILYSYIEDELKKWNH